MYKVLPVCWTPLAGGHRPGRRAASARAPAGTCTPWRYPPTCPYPQPSWLSIAYLKNLRIRYCTRGPSEIKLM